MLMHEGKLVLSQLMDFIPKRDFDECVKRYRGNYHAKEFSCRDQFLAMTFAQLTYRESLRDIETCLNAVQPKLYHAGFRGRVAKSTLSDANRRRDWRSTPTSPKCSSSCASVVRQGQLRCRTETCRLCLGLDDDRPVPCTFSVGTISSTQGRCEASYADRSPRQHPLFYRVLPVGVCEAF